VLREVVGDHWPASNDLLAEAPAVGACTARVTGNPACIPEPDDLPPRDLIKIVKLEHRSGYRLLGDPVSGAVVAAVDLQPTHPAEIRPLGDIAADRHRAGLEFVTSGAMRRGNLAC
jgi:hypothetical protein